MKLFGSFEAVKFYQENLIFITHDGYLYYIYNLKYKHWEKHRNADHLVERIQAEMLAHGSDIRHGKKGDEQCAANPKRSANAPRLKCPRQKHPHRKREKHTHQPSPEIHFINRPADTDATVTGNIADEKPRVD